MADKDVKVGENTDDVVTDKEQVMDIEDLLFDGDVKEGAKDAEQPDEDAEKSEAEADDEVDDAAEEGSEEEEESSETEEDESESEDEGPSYQELLDRIAKLEKAGTKKKKEKEVEEEEEEEESEAEADVGAEEDFLKGRHFDDMSAKEINKLLNSIVNKAVERALVTAPKVVCDQIQQQQYINKLITNFYSENQDLADKKELVGMIAAKIQGENPGWSYEKILGETKKKTYKYLNLKATAKEKEKEAPPEVGLKKSSSSRSAPQVEGMKKNLATDIAETIFD